MLKVNLQNSHSFAINLEENPTEFWQIRSPFFRKKLSHTPIDNYFSTKSKILTSQHLEISGILEEFSPRKIKLPL